MKRKCEICKTTHSPKFYQYKGGRLTIMCSRCYTKVIALANMLSHDGIRENMTQEKYDNFIRPLRKELDEILGKQE